MRIAEILNENFLDNDPEWDLVTLIDTFKARPGTEKIGFTEFLRSAQEQGFDIDEDWLKEFLDRQKEAGLISDFDEDKDFIVIDDSFTPNSDDFAGDDGDDEEDAEEEGMDDKAKAGEEKQDQTKEKVSSKATQQAKQSVKDK
jgi:hypothetical protein